MYNDFYYDEKYDETNEEWFRWRAEEDEEQEKKFAKEEERRNNPLPF
jgi:hypothetical protein